MQTLLVVLDVAGTFVFALSGALVCFGLRMVGVRRGRRLPTPRP